MQVDRRVSYTLDLGHGTSKVGSRGDLHVEIECLEDGTFNAVTVYEVLADGQLDHHSTFSGVRVEVLERVAAAVATLREQSGQMTPLPFVVGVCPDHGYTKTIPCASCATEAVAEDAVDRLKGQGRLA